MARLAAVLRLGKRKLAPLLPRNKTESTIFTVLHITPVPLATAPWYGFAASRYVIEQVSTALEKRDLLTRITLMFREEASGNTEDYPCLRR